MIDCKLAQGHEVEDFHEEVLNVPDSYDAIADLARRIVQAPLREGWPYVEPNALEEIWKECDPDRPLGRIADISPEEAAARVEAAFLGAVCGCMLGKPLEVNPTLEEIRTAGEKSGDWPINDYISESLTENLGRQHRSWKETTRENLKYVVPDDDINYTTLGMLILEEKGIGFTKHDLMDLWLRQLPVFQTFGPERTLLIKAGMHSIGGCPEDPFEEWASIWNPRSEWCGAQIRADAYGYACSGRPALAAELAYKDASWTHRRTGIYGTMYVAAAIACAQVMDDRMEVMKTALKFVPQKSRFYEITADCIDMVEHSSDWLEGYGYINGKYGQYTHCQIYQETGSLVNSMKFAQDVGHGICIQVSQGMDTDCYGEIIGSLLGAFMGPGHLEDRWLAPFNDEIRTSLAQFYEYSLSSLAKRMAKLPALINKQL